jgi:hypothetical protein
VLGECGPTLEARLRVGTLAAAPAVYEVAQKIRAGLAQSAEQMRPPAAEEETARPPIGLKATPALGWLSGVALSSAVLVSFVRQRRRWSRKKREGLFSFLLDTGHPRIIVATTNPGVSYPTGA